MRKYLDELLETFDIVVLEVAEGIQSAALVGSASQVVRVCNQPLAEVAALRVVFASEEERFRVVSQIRAKCKKFEFQGFSGNFRDSALKGLTVGAVTGSVLPVIGTIAGAFIGTVGALMKSAYSEGIDRDTVLENLAKYRIEERAVLEGIFSG